MNSTFASTIQAASLRDPRVAGRSAEPTSTKVAASRRTTGNHPLYEELEAALAKFFGAEGALLVSNGYATGMAVAQACLGGFSEVLVDERAHGCIADVAPLFGAEPQSFARNFFLLHGYRDLESR